ncbi:MAG: acetyl-CoA carboxylase biotin carboxyl carrier protein [Chitinophagales bacterium]
MDFKEIQELIRMVNKYNVAELTIEEQEFRIKIKTTHGASAMPNPVVLPQMQQPVIMQQAQPVATPVKTETKSDDASKTESSAGGDNLITIKSPIVGTFYRSAGPDKDPFVKVGDEINVGSKLCIIEAMKLFNEIESEHSGRIVKILLDDASPVEYDQPLFLIEPK